MRVTRYDDVDAFANAVFPYLREREAEHCLLFGIINTRRREPSVYNESLYLSHVTDQEGAIILVAVQTPGHNMVLSHLAVGRDPSEAISMIVKDAHDALQSLPGVHAPDTLASEFAQEWCAGTDVSFRVDVRERIYRLTQVRWPTPAPGHPRRIHESDRDLLRSWLQEFSREAMGHDDPDIERVIDRRLQFQSSGMYVWDDNGLTSLCGFGGPTPHGIRIGPVYTPPALRGKGYASSLVASVSQTLLDGGRDFCFLFTDLMNPTSNHIYQDIGYESVSDVMEFVFVPR